jgi:hypothetical protein
MSKLTANIQKLNLTTAKKVVAILKKMVRDMTDFDGKPYSQLMNPRAGRSADTRLNDTGRFADNWVIVDNASPEGFAIADSKGIHKGGISYSAIRMYNDKNSGFTNQNIEDPPALTPSSDDQVSSMEWFKEYTKAVQDLIDADIKENMVDIKKEITIKV